MQKYRRFFNTTILQAIWTVLAEAKAPKEVKEILSDLLYPSEIALIGQRFQIAKMLSEEWTYDQIRGATNASANTIGRVWQTIQKGTGGYAKAFRVLSELKEKATYQRRRYDLPPEDRYLRRRLEKGK